MASNAAQKGKTVGDPIAEYDSMTPLWLKGRAACGGERFVKEYDRIIDVHTFSNLLIPFSPSMSQEQYNFYRAEAEYPGIVSQYAKIIVGGLLRKQPTLKLPKDVSEDAYQWIMDAFTQDSSPLISYLDKMLWEEMQTNRAWNYIAYPKVANPDDLTSTEWKKIKPYPILWKAESVINWRLGIDPESGREQLMQLIYRCYESDFSKSEFHAELKDTVYVHEIVGGFYQIRKYQLEDSSASIPVVNGSAITDHSNSATKGFVLKETNTSIMFNGERLKIIPAWPANGSVTVIEPILTSLIDREISLYNKLSRRNHLLYGACTYTPVICSDMEKEDFEKIVNAGLGTWIKLEQGDTATVLATPTDALKDLEVAIAATVEDMAKMGLRMLAPETAQSGVALDIRNAAQTAQLGVFNTKISNQLADMIAFMLNWRYDTKYTSSDVEFQMSADFNPTPLGADWLRLVTEWYEAGHLPRTIWLEICKTNDLIPPDYDDIKGQQEITASDIFKRLNDKQYENDLKNLTNKP